MKRATLILSASLALLSCMNSKLPKYVELSELRILSLMSDKPEVNPSETVTITPLISDINETTSLSFEAYGCIDPGIAQGAQPTCASNSTKVNLSQGTITSASNTDMSQNFTGAAPTFSAVIPAESVIFNQRSAMDKFNGVGYLIEYKVSNPRGQSVSSIKRILVSNKLSSQKNLNPVVDELQANGTALATTGFPVNGIYTIGMVFNSNSFQVYTTQKEDGSTEDKSEELTTTWFITDGSLKFFRSINQSTNEFTAPAAVPSTRKSFLISISRDSRGGIAYKRICGGC